MEDATPLMHETESFREWAAGRFNLLAEDIVAWSQYIWRWLFQHWPLGPIRSYPPTESANFTTINNERTRKSAISRKKKEGAWRSALRWLCLTLMGVCVAALYQLIHGTMDIITEWKSAYLQDYMKEGRFGLGWFVNFLIMLMLVVTAGLLALIEPNAAGGGVAEVISFLNGARPTNLFTFRTFFLKAIGVTLAVASGAFLGPEGPFIHFGAIAGALIPFMVHFVLQHVPVLGKAMEGLVTDTEERNFVVAGAAVGISSAFSAPIGGTMFVLEEALSFFDSKLIFRTYFTCATSYFTAKLLKEGHWLSTSSLTFSSTALMTTCYPGYGAEDLIMFSIMGIIGGLLGVLFNTGFVRCQMWRARWIKKWGWRKLVEMSCIVFVTSLFVAFVPIHSKCSPATQLASHLPNFDERDPTTFVKPSTYSDPNYCISTNTQNYFLNYSSDQTNVNDFLEAKYLRTALCPEGYYNELASLFQVSLHEATTLLFASGAYNMFHASSIAAFGCVFLVICFITAGMAVPAGIFVPSMCIGACLGRILAIFTNTFVKIPLGVTPIDPGPWATIGAAAFLCGSSRITVTTAIIILEITGDFRYIPGIAIAVVFAKMTGGFFTKSIYHMMIHLKDIPFLEDIPGSQMDNVYVRDLMSSPVVSLLDRESVANARRVLKGCKHNGFPVLHDEGEGAGKHMRLCGLILRRDLQRLVDHAPHDAVNLDLAACMNETPFTVQPEFTMSQCFRMFRTLGLRHLPVVNRDFELQGIVTRRDFLEPHSHHTHDKHAVHELKTILTAAAAAELEEELDGGVEMTHTAVQWGPGGENLPLPPTTFTGSQGETEL